MVDGKQGQWSFIFSNKPQGKCVKWVSLPAKKILLLLAKYLWKRTEIMVSPEVSCHYLMKALTALDKPQDSTS